MPYRNNDLKVFNEGLDFVDSEYYDGCSAARLMIGCLLRGFDVLDSMVSMIPPVITGISRSAGMTPARYLETLLDSHAAAEELVLLARTDSVYSRFHRPLLMSMLQKGNIDSYNFHLLADEIAYGREGDTYDVLKLTRSPTRYWQSLLIDYALSVDGSGFFEQEQKNTEVGAACARMLPACYGFTAGRLFSRKSYGTLPAVMDAAMERWPHFKFALWEHFDPVLAGLDDKAVLSYETLFSTFRYSPGLARIMRVYVQKGEHASAERVARKLFAHEDDSTPVLRALFDAYVDHEQRDRALEVFRQMQEGFNPMDDSYDKEARIAEHRVRRDDDEAEKEGSLGLALLLHEI